MEYDETNPADLGQETPAPEPVEKTDVIDEIEDGTTPDEGDAPDGEDGDSGQEGEQEYAEIEINGKRYAVPVELKDGYLMHADYTRKTQGVADEKRQIEASRAQIEAIREATDHELNARAELIGINQLLQQYQQVDWNAWQNDDPMAAQSGWMEYQQLRDRAGQAAEYLNGAEKRRTEAAQQDTARRLQETREYAAKEIPGWTPETDAKLTDFAINTLGFPMEALMGAINPMIYRTLHMAWVGSQAMKNGAGKPQALKPSIKPLKTVSAKSAPPVNPTDISDTDEYVRIMNQRERKRSQR